MKFKEIINEGFGDPVDVHISSLRPDSSGNPIVNFQYDKGIPTVVDDDEWYKIQRRVWNDKEAFNKAEQASAKLTEACRADAQAIAEAYYAMFCGSIHAYQLKILEVWKQLADTQPSIEEIDAQNKAKRDAALKAQQAGNNASAT